MSDQSQALVKVDESLTSDVRLNSTVEPSISYKNFQAVTKVSSEFLILDSENPNPHGHRPSYGPEYVHKRQSIYSTSGDEDDEQDYDHHTRNRSTRAISFASANSQGSNNSFTKHQEKGDLEIWWLHSPTWRRTILLMCVTMLTLSISHAVFAVYCFTAQDPNAKDVDVCKTQGCLDIADWINQGLDKSVDPCVNFHDFVCGNYSNPNEPPELVTDSLDFSTAEYQFNDQGVLAKALNPAVGIRENKLIDYYKSCLDIRRRRATDLSVMAKIINATFPFLFTDPVNFSKADGGRRIAVATGHVGFFGYQLLDFPKVAILPPPDWILEYSKTLSDSSSNFNFTKELTKTYTKLWAKLEKKIGKPLLEVDRAVNLTTWILTLMSNISFDNGDANTSAFETVRRTNLLLGSILGDNWVQSAIEVEGKRFTTADITNIINNVYRQITPDPNRGPALLSFWIYCTLEYYADELTQPARVQLNLHNLFPHRRTQFQFQDTSLERYCFESLSEHLNGHTYNRFVRYLDPPDVLTARMGRAFREIRRVMRFIYFAEKLPDILRPRDALIMTAFMNPRNNITLRYPFPHNEQTRKFFNELESFYSNFTPGPDFLVNVRDATMKEHIGQLASWKQKRIDFRRRQSFELEKFSSEIDNAVEYENNVYPPVGLFDRPLFLNDMRVFDHAGAILYLTRNFLSLWRKNLVNPSPLLNILEDPVFGNIERSKSLTNQLGGDCEIKKKRSTRQEFFDLPVSRNALAFIISLQLLRNSIQYASLTHKSNGTIAEQVEPLFYANGSFDYVQVVMDGGKFPKYKFLDKSDFVPLEREKFKFQYKRAPNGLEEFTEEQLFFIASVRHHCYNLGPRTRRSQQFVSNVNGVLEQVEEFAEAWNCPLGAPMNPPNKCV